MRIATISRGGPTGWGATGRLLAIVLVGALLLCHGAYGASHLVCDALHYGHYPQANTHEAAGEHPAKHQGGTGEVQHLGHVAYAAIILVLSLGAFLLLRRDAKKWVSEAPNLFFKRVVSPVSLGPSQRLGLPLLQVFRL